MVAGVLLILPVVACIIATVYVGVFTFNLEKRERVLKNKQRKYGERSSDIYSRVFTVRSFTALLLIAVYFAMYAITVLLPISTVLNAAIKIVSMGCALFGSFLFISQMLKK